MKFQVWACDLDGQEFDEDSSYTIHPVMTGVLTIHWADGRASHYSPAAWQRGLSSSGTASGVRACWLLAVAATLCARAWWVLRSAR